MWLRIFMWIIRLPIVPKYAELSAGSCLCSFLPMAFKLDSGFISTLVLDATSHSLLFQKSLTSLPLSLGVLLASLHSVSLSTCHSDSSATVMEVDHDRQLVFCETLPCLSSSSSSPASPSSRLCTNALSLLGAPQPSDEQVAARLSAPVVATQLDTRNISFERWGHNNIDKSLSPMESFAKLQLGHCDPSMGLHHTVGNEAKSVTQHFQAKFHHKMCEIGLTSVSMTHGRPCYRTCFVSAGIKQGFLAGGVRKQRRWMGTNQR